MTEEEIYIEELYNERIEKLILLLVEKYNYLQNDLRLEEYIINKYDKIKEQLEYEKNKNSILIELSKSEIELNNEIDKLKNQIKILEINNTKLIKDMILQKNTTNIIYVDKKEVKFNYNNCIKWWDNLLYVEKISLCKQYYKITYNIKEVKENIRYVDIKKIYKAYKENSIQLDVIN